MNWSSCEGHWQCRSCLQWTPYGTYHICNAISSAPSPPSIIHELRRIADALEKLSGLPPAVAE